MSDQPEILWQPDEETVRRARITAFAQRVAREHGASVDDYDLLWQWSTDHVPEFWGTVVDHLGVRFHEQPREVLASSAMPGASWFPGATLNYAEHALWPREGGADGDTAIVAVREDGRRVARTFGELRADVARARAGLVALGVGFGDRVVALSPNSVETLVAFLAASSLGATWSSCSPDFGPRAVVDRFAQIEPSVLVAVDGYLYNGKSYDIRDTVGSLRAQLPTLSAVVGIDYLADGAWAGHDGVVGWASFTDHPDAELAVDPVPFDHPLWILYSSGTTGLPKGIVHSHGGIVVEHLKALSLQHDLGPGDRFTWFTTTGWMMWNLLISGLLVGTTVVAYDGSPGHPDLDVLWKMAADEGVTLFGTSASFVQSCLKAGLRPKDAFDLTAIRSVGSTGSPLSPEGFDWIRDAVGSHIQIASVSGGTDTCAAFVGVAPTVPVWRGEISCRALGCAVESFDPQGNPMIDEVGELVITQPMPSMPVMLWNDPDGSRMHESYFEDFPGIWRHGDWIRITPRGSCVIRGRSDSTLNRGGVRMGTAEFYEVVESFDEVLDSLVIDTSGLEGARDGGELLCFLVLGEGVSFSDVEPQLKKALRSQLSPRHVPDRFLVVEDIPRTLNGKKSEVPVKRILAGTPVEKAVSKDALRNPEALETVVARARD
ncbi:acetoacetyl-CoA synthetase [Actinomycetospora sp. NBRC 106375]|uniref:acetoacetate--CoA ligase n=1 Tax=Actinomycetospora sp. NBRC 106375 TaxID=3032207 RepID=UPI0024A20C17|nr:acetoacetate--CoA ligase [Actinomycetospora sp. NBRC 106375]GLZ46240.1 acetoacetyl-CoA synthetase [Actinomycetospora sp. NBRC 106375]